MFKINYSIFSMVILLLSDTTYANSTEQQPHVLAANPHLVSFDSSALFGNDKNINLARFQTEDYIYPGEYLVNTRLNGRDLGLINTKFKHMDSLDNFESAVLCIDQGLLQQLSLKADILEQLDPKKACYLIKDLAPDAYYVFTQSELKLDLYIPQLYVIEHPKGYIDPKRFSNGVSSGFIGYQLNYNKSDENESKYLALIGGLNVGGWFFRHSGNFNSGDSNFKHYQSVNNVLYKDITSLKSRLSLGQLNTQNYNLDNISIVGAQLSSDLDMLPASQRAYAPVIKNIAYSNALIKIYQNGQQIYEKSVPAGPFEIQDLMTYGTGNLLLEINETGGEQRVFSIPFQNNINLLRKGILNYNLAAGQYYFQNKTTQDYIIQSNFNYGLSNYITGLIGTNIAEHFYSVLVGGAFNTSWGGLSLQAESQKTQLYTHDLTGTKINFNYKYAWPKSHFSFSTDYTYFNQEYLSLSNYLYLKNRENNSAGNLNFDYSFNIKNTYGFYLAKSLVQQHLGSLSLGYRKNEYWDRHDSFEQYILSYHNSYKKISYNLGMTQTTYSNNIKKDDINAYLSISLPLQWKDKNLYANSNLQHSNQNNQTTITNRISGNFGSNNELSYGLGLQNYLSGSSANNDGINGYINYRLPQASLASTIDYSTQNTQYSLSASGAIVAHPYGVSLVNYTPTTYTIIHAEDAKGAKLQNAWGVKIDRFGNAIYPSNIPYQSNTISLDPSDLPVNVNFLSNQSQVIPKKYSAQLVIFNTQKSSNILLSLSAPHHDRLPIGSQLFSQQGQMIGTLGPTQQVLVEDEQALMYPMQLKWGEDEQDSCQIEGLNPQDLKNKTKKNFIFIHAECK